MALVRGTKNKGLGSLGVGFNCRWTKKTFVEVLQASKLGENRGKGGPICDAASRPQSVELLPNGV